MVLTAAAADCFWLFRYRLFRRLLLRFAVLCTCGYCALPAAVLDTWFCVPGFCTALPFCRFTS